MAAKGAGSGSAEQGNIRKFEKPTKPVGKRRADGSIILGSFNPDEMGPEFDVVTELTERRDLYAAGQEAVQTTVRSFPSMCHTNISRLRNSFSDSRPGLNPTVAACIHWGLRTMLADGPVQNFIAVRRRFEACDTSFDVEIYDVIEEMFKDLGCNLPRGPRLTLRVPAATHEEIGSLAVDLGLRVETVIGLTSYITLAEQNTTMKAHARAMRSEVDSFLRRLGLRARVIGAAMREVELAARET